MLIELFFSFDTIRLSKKKQKVYHMLQKAAFCSYGQGTKDIIVVQHWNFTGPIFQANQALTESERLVRELALV